MRTLNVAALPHLMGELQRRPWKVAANPLFAPVNGDVEIRTHYCDQATDKKILFLSGAHSYGHLVWHQIEPLSRGTADTAVATYNAEAFDAQAIARSLADYIGNQHSDLTFVCASLGGLIGYDTLALLRERFGNYHRVNFKLIDSPMRFGNINLKGAAQSIGSECGTLALSAFQRLWHQTEALPVFGNLLPENEMLLRLEELAGRTFPFGGFGRQALYLLRHRGVDSQVLGDCRGEFYRSSLDNLVVQAAHTDWSNVFGYRLPLRVIPNVTHVDLVRNAAVYRTHLTAAA